MRWKAALQKALQLQPTAENLKSQKKEKSSFDVFNTIRCIAERFVPSCKGVFQPRPFLSRFSHEEIQNHFQNDKVSSSDSANHQEFSSKDIFLRLWRGYKRSQTQESAKKDSSPQQEKDLFRLHCVREYKLEHLNEASSRCAARKSDQAGEYFCTC